MVAFKPEVDYDSFKKNNIKCGVDICKEPLTSENYGEKIDEHRGYAPANSYYLAKWGFFCNDCSVKIIEAEESNYKKETAQLKKSISPFIKEY